MSLTESTVVLSGPLYGAIRMDLQVKARPAVELSPPQNPLQMTEVRQAPGQPLRGHEVLLLLQPVSSCDQSTCRVVVHGPSWGKNEMRANGSLSGTRVSKAVQKCVGKTPHLGRCPHHR